MLGGTHECHPAPCTSTGDTYMKVDYPIISADSHITEAPNTYTDCLDPAGRERAPHLVDGGDQMGDMFVVEGSAVPIPMGLVAAAGKDPSEIRTKGTRFEELHRGGWDPTARLAEQDGDGVAAEIIYPTVGMVLCNIDDFDLKKASFDAYNRWRSEEHTSELQSLMRIPYAAFCLKKKKTNSKQH